MPKKYSKYIGTQGQDEGYHEIYKIGKYEVDVYPPHYGERYWTVIWNGAVDYTGNKRQMLRRYPELKPQNVRYAKIGSKEFNY